MWFTTLKISFITISSDGIEYYFGCIRNDDWYEWEGCKLYTAFSGLIIATYCCGIHGMARLLEME